MRKENRKAERWEGVFNLPVHKKMSKPIVLVYPHYLLYYYLIYSRMKYI